MGEHPRRLHIPSLEETAQVVYEPWALERCGDPELAKRLTAARYWRESRRPGADGHRVLLAPTPELPEPE